MKNPVFCSDSCKFHYNVEKDVVSNFKIPRHRKTRCSFCKQKIAKQKNVYVSVYEVSREYGGPAEGGVYFDDYVYAGESHIKRNIKSAKRYADKLQESLEDCQPKYNRYSVLGTEDLVVVIEDYPGERGQRERYHGYE